MTEAIHVVAVAGSLRQKSYNRAALHAARELLPEDMTLEVFDIGAIPLFNEDVEAQGYPDSVQQFKARIAASDAMLISTPEYNYSMPGVLKNALDWASRPASATPLNGKPLAIMGVSSGPWGTARAQLHLRQSCVYFNMHPLNRPVVQISHAEAKFDTAGTLKDEAGRHQIRALLEALAVWARKLK
jgi:chromate reductase